MTQNTVSNHSKRLHSSSDDDISIVEPGDLDRHVMLQDCVCIIIPKNLKDRVLQFLSTAIENKADTPKALDPSRIKKWEQSYKGMHKELNTNMHKFSQEALIADLEDEGDLDDFKEIRSQLKDFVLQGEHTVKMVAEIKKKKPYFLQSKLTVRPNKIDSSITANCLKKVNKTVTDLDLELCTTDFERSETLTESVVDKFTDVHTVEDIRSILAAKAWRAILKGKGLLPTETGSRGPKKTGQQNNNNRKFQNRRQSAVYGKPGRPNPWGPERKFGGTKHWRRDGQPQEYRGNDRPQPQRRPSRFYYRNDPQRSDYQSNRFGRSHHGDRTYYYPHPDRHYSEYYDHDDYPPPRRDSYRDEREEDVFW